MAKSESKPKPKQKPKAKPKAKPRAKAKPKAKVDEDLQKTDPLRAIESILEAWDPSSTTETLKLMLAMEEANDGEAPSKAQWARLLKLAKEELKTEPVTSKMKLEAAKILADYKYPKRKSVEVTTKSEKVELTELNEKELRRFHDYFEKHY